MAVTGRCTTPVLDARALWFEGVAMALYISIVMMSAVVALPQEEEPAADDVALAAVWGGAAGLALAHAFAFGLASRVVHGPTTFRDDRRIALAQLAGALSVALFCTLPILLPDTERRFDTVLWVLAAIIAGSGYFAARRAGAGRLRALLAASAALAIGATVVAVKLLLEH